MPTIEGNSAGEASQSCLLGESKTMPQKKLLHGTNDFKRLWQEEITSAKRMEGKVGGNKRLRLNLEKKPNLKNVKIQNNQYNRSPWKGRRI